jgi:pilus assembly protein CpaF
MRSVLLKPAAFLSLRREVHEELLTILDLSIVEGLPTDSLRAELQPLIASIVKDKGMQLPEEQLEQLLVAIQNEVRGLGPIQSLMEDPDVSDILVNGPYSVYVETLGQLKKTDARFEDASHLINVIERIVSKVGRRIDESSPMVDARLSDGSRVNAVIPPLSLDGPVLSIRRFSAVPMKAAELIARGSLSPQMLVFIELAVRARVNFLVSGGTGSGKTTLLNTMSGYVPDTERIITIEDAAELRLQQPHVIRLETRPPNVEGNGEISQRALVRNSLRMRPDRIIIGEVRGHEVVDMLQAMNTGHEGSMTTVHANSPRDAISRLENMVEFSGMGLGLRPVRQQIASAISIVIQIARMSDGRRRVLSVQEITGMDGDLITMQEIFGYRQEGVKTSGEVDGAFYAAGFVPRIADRFTSRGLSVPLEIFECEERGPLTEVRVA